MPSGISPAMKEMKVMKVMKVVTSNEREWKEEKN